MLEEDGVLRKMIDSLFDQSRDDCAAEIEALQSIYGDSSVRIHVHSSDSSSRFSPTIRYDVSTSLTTPFEDISFTICVSLPPGYPSYSAPLLQLTSRYIGPYSVDADLFGNVTRTFISTKSGVLWRAGEVVVFDGIESIRSLITDWYKARLTDSATGGTTRDDSKEDHETLNHDAEDYGAEDARGGTARPPVDEFRSAFNSDSEGKLEGIEIIEGPTIQDRGSAFVARVCRISHPSQVPAVIEYLHSDRHIKRAAHPAISAWRCTVDGIMHSDNDDDGESAAGSRLAHLLQILEIDHVLVVVTRYFGGIHLGPDRFKHINQCARDALELGGFLDEGKSQAQRIARTGKGGRKAKR